MRSAAVAILLVCAPAAAQDKPLSLDVLYHPDRKVDFAGTAPRGLTWLDERRLHWPRKDHRTELTEHFVIDADSGERRALFDPAALQAALARVPGVDAEKARELARQKAYVLD